MPALYTEIQVAGEQAAVDTISYGLNRPTDHIGHSSSRVRVKTIKLTLSGLAALLGFWDEWAADSVLRRSGRIVFYDGEDKIWRVLSFFNARCTLHRSRFRRGSPGAAAYTLTLEISAAAIDIHGVHVKAFSLIPWATDEATSYRALTQPPPPLPSLRLRATGVAPDAILATGLVGVIATNDIIASATERPFLKNDADPLHDVLGPGKDSHPQEWAATIEALRQEGVRVVFRDGVMAYGPDSLPGCPGQLIIDPEASIGALRHETQHFKDDKALGFLGSAALYKNPRLRWGMEFAAYLQEVALARQLKNFTVGFQLISNARDEKNYIRENFGPF